MKHLINIWLVLISLCGFSQDNIVSFDSDFNQIDRHGLRYGRWINYSTDTILQYWNTLWPIDKDSAKANLSGTDTIICRFVFSQGFYLNDKKDGVWQVFNTDRQMKVRMGDSIMIGDLIYEANFRSDSLNGLLKTYYQTGGLKSEIEFKDGLANGNIICYFKNGKTRYQGQMIPGQDFFSGQEYNDKGARIRDRKFNYDIIMSDWTDLDDFKRRLLID